PPPSLAALPIFTDKDSEPHAGATIALLATRSQLQHVLAQFIARCPMARWRRNGNRGRLFRHRAIFRRNQNPGSIPALLIASVLVIMIAPRPRLTLCSNGCPGGAADNRAEHSTAAAIECSAQDCPGSTTDDRSAYWILCGRIPHRRNHYSRHQGCRP